MLYFSIYLSETIGTRLLRCPLIQAERDYNLSTKLLIREVSSAKVGCPA